MNMFPTGNRVNFCGRSGSQPSRRRASVVNPLTEGNRKFRAPRPDQEIEVEVRVRKLGAASVTYALTGHDGAGQHYFRATLVGCFVARPDFKPTRVPDQFRARIAAYQAACGDG